MRKLLTMIALLAVLLTATCAMAECHHTYDMVDVKKVTCETDGYYILKCNDCGHTVKEITDKAYGHDWAYVTGQEADCTEDGFKRYMCGNCGETRIETVNAPGHKWKDSHVLEEATCKKDGSMRTVCEVCGLSGTRVIEKGHKYGEWTITEEATDHSRGTRTRTCRVCKKKQTEEYYPEGTLYKDIKGHSDEIKALQQKLTDLGFLNDKVDGKFGKKTQAAVKAFQKAYGLTADGIAWPQTLSALDAAWNAEFGVPEDTYAPCCGFLEIDENGTQYWDHCEVHANISMHAADELPEDASEAERANAYAVAWQRELERLYQLWLENCAPEDQPMVINHKTMFLGYLNSQQFLWNTQYGEGSLNALDRVNEMLMYQCFTLCSVVYEGEKMKCPACGSEFEVDEIEARYASQTAADADFDLPTQGYAAADVAQLQAYNCKTCGAELITESTTTATECPYCGSPTILPERIDGGIRPEMVVPFVITKEQAQEMFYGYFKGKALLPNIFKKDNQIAEMRKLFVPYWLFDCEAHGSVVYDAQKESSYTDGDEEVTEVEHYIVRRGGNMSFENIPVDGSVKMDDKITESLEPYDLTKAVAFTPAVLSGAMADHADVDADACEARAVNRATGSFKSALEDTIDGYTSLSEKSSSVHVAGSKVTPVLLPVWLITTVKDGKTYTFAINGQTGRLTCNVPTAKGKAFLWGAVSFAGVLGLTALILHLTKALGSGTLLMAAIFALFVTIGIVGTMIGKLKQATAQSGATGYACEGGLNLTLESDSYQYSKKERRKIEKSSD